MQANPTTSQQPAQHAPPNPLLLVHRYLRGRYWLVIPLAMLAAIPGAIGGYLALKPTYLAMGRIEVKPSFDPLLYESEFGSQGTSYQFRLASEAMFITSERVIAEALRHERMRAIGWPEGPEGAQALRSALSADHQRHTQFINVTVEHEERRLAVEAARAVMESYMALQESSAKTSYEQTETALRSRLQTKLAERDRIRSEIRTLTREKYAIGDLERLQNQTFDDKSSLKNMLNEIDLQLLGMPEQASASQEEDGDRELTIDELAAWDQELQGLIEERDASRRAYERLKLRGFGEDHRDVKSMRVAVDQLSDDIDDRVEELRAKGGPSQDASFGSPHDRYAYLVRRRERVAQQLDETEELLRQLGPDVERLENLRNEEAEIQRQIDDIDLKLEARDANRSQLREGLISIREEATAPPFPNKDRRLPLAVAGAGAAGGTVVGLFLLVGFLDRRIRHVDQIESAHLAAPLLGVLPLLSGKRAESREIALESVHHLRNMLEVQLDALRPALDRSVSAGTPCAACGHDLGGLPTRATCPACGLDIDRSAGGSTRDRAPEAAPRGRSVAITSAGSGDGKTSVTAALGMSFAASGHRTVVVDADMVGRSLSLAFGLEKAPGLSDLGAGAPLNGELKRADVDNLWVLPVGRIEGLRPEQLSSEFAVRLLRQLEAQFDIVLIDTGPLLGSLEANLAVGNATGTLLVTARGQDSKLVQTSLRRIGDVGGHCVGMVYNRAGETDMLSSASAVSSSRATRSSADRTPRDRAGGTELITVMRSQQTAHAQDS